MKIDILYSGQLRYVETSQRQKNLFISVEHETIFSVLDYVQDSYTQLSLKSSHMFDDTVDFNTALDYISKQLNPKQVKTFSRQEMITWFEKTYEKFDPYQLFYVQHIFTFLEGLKYCDKELTLSVTSDLIVEGNLKLALETVNPDVPEIYTHQNSSIIPHVIILNRKARETILKNADDFLATFFKVNDKSVWEKAENIWQCLFEFCGIKFKTLRNVHQCKVKPTMTKEDLQKPINMLSVSRKNWRDFKDSATSKSSFKIQKEDTTRIVAYGCSYTAGDEFLDTSIHPDAEELKKKNIKEWFKHKSAADPALIQTLNLKQLHMAWPAILASKMSLPVDNRAIGGNSLPNILYQIERDHQQGNIKSKDLVFVGLTGYERNIYFTQTEAIPVIMHMKENFPRHLQDYQGPIADFNNSMYMYYFYYLCLFRLIKLSETYLSNRLIIVPCINDANYRWFNSSLEKYFTKDILRLRDECLEHNSILTDLNLYNFVNSDKEDLHGGGHPRQIVHRRFVDHLLDQLKSKKVF